MRLIRRLTRSHPPNNGVSSFAPRNLALPRSSPDLARSSPVPRPASPVPRPFLARSSPGLARSSPGLRPFLARPSPDPAHHRFKQSSRQNGQKRNLLPPGPGCPRNISPEDFLFGPLLLMAGSLYGGGAQTNPNFREKFLSFSQKDFLSGGYRNRSSGIHR